MNGRPLGRVEKLARFPKGGSLGGAVVEKEGEWAEGVRSKGRIVGGMAGAVELVVQRG